MRRPSLSLIPDGFIRRCNWSGWGLHSVNGHHVYCLCHHARTRDLYDAERLLHAPRQSTAPDRPRRHEDAWIIDLLQRAPVATLATVYEGQPFINTNLFVYEEDQHVVYMHTARSGRTRNNVNEAERVCLSVFEMGRLLPNEIALEFSVEYKGVNIFGRATVIEGEEAQRRSATAVR